jgi:taurine dioxygenase
MQYTITPLTSHETGAEIRGLDLSKPLQSELRQALNQAFARHHVLVFRDQKLSPREFAGAAGIFGEIMPQAIKGFGTKEHPDVFELRPMAVAPGEYQAPGGGGFHTDHSFDPHPPKATSLHPVVLPSRGGDTQFCNVHLAYDDLPEATKQRIDRLQAVHAYYSKISAYKVRKLDAESLAALPKPAVHPLVPVHPENSKRYLYVNQSRMESIVGMEDADAIELINQLLQHATQSKYEYRHVWRDGDMVIWDNRSVLHKANGDYDMSNGGGRLMYRVMLKGTAPLAYRA